MMGTFDYGHEMYINRHKFSTYRYINDININIDKL